MGKSLIDDGITWRHGRRPGNRQRPQKCTDWGRICLFPESNGIECVLLEALWHNSVLLRQKSNQPVVVTPRMTGWYAEFSYYNIVHDFYCFFDCGFIEKMNIMWDEKVYNFFQCDSVKDIGWLRLTTPSTVWS